MHYKHTITGKEINVIKGTILPQTWQPVEVKPAPETKPAEVKDTDPKETDVVLDGATTEELNAQGVTNEQIDEAIEKDGEEKEAVEIPTEFTLNNEEYKKITTNNGTTQYRKAGALIKKTVYIEAAADLMGVSVEDLKA